MKKILAAAVALVAVAAVLAWPRLNVVETGRTPEYPDLVPRRYAATPDRVVETVEAVVHAMPRWTLKGSGSL